jgi:hypothetical protein
MYTRLLVPRARYDEAIYWRRRSKLFELATLTTALSFVGR